MSPRRPLPLDLSLAPFTIDEGRTRGLTVKRLRGSDLVIPVRGVRLPRAEEASLTARCRALGLHVTHGEWAFSHATAAALWGLPLPRGLESSKTIHATVWAGRYPPRVRDVVGHRAAEAPPTRQHRGLRLIAASDVWCQLSPVLSELELIQAGDRLLGRPEPLAAVDEVDEALDRYGKRRGCRSLRSAREHLDVGSESPKETGLRLRVLEAGFPEPESNGVITLRSGRSTHGDLVFRRWMVLLEYDGAHHREDDGQWAKDVDRLNELAGNGWLVIRVNKHSDFEVIARQLSDALELRGWTRS